MRWLFTFLLSVTIVCSSYLLLSSLYQREQKANGIHRYLFPLLRSEDVYVIDTNPNVIPLAHKLSPDYNANYTFQSLRIRTHDGVSLLPSYNDYLKKNMESVQNAELHNYTLVLGVLDEVDSVDYCKENALQSYVQLMKTMDVKVVYFTSSPAIVERCKSLGIDVIEEYLVNFSGMPLLRELLKRLQQTYISSFYGYIDSRLLLSSSIGPVLDALLDAYKNGTLSSGFMVSGVSFSLRTPAEIPSQPSEYDAFLKKSEKRQTLRDRCSSDFWIFHQSAVFDEYADAVLFRDELDHYIMSQTADNKRSIVDVTFSVTSVKQDECRNAQHSFDKDWSVDDITNSLLLRAHLLEPFCLSSPGAFVLEREDRFVLRTWESDSAACESHYNSLVHRIPSL